MLFPAVFFGTDWSAYIEFESEYDNTSLNVVGWLFVAFLILVLASYSAHLFRRLGERTRPPLVFLVGSSIAYCVALMAAVVTSGDAQDIWDFGVSVTASMTAFAFVWCLNRRAHAR